MAMQAVAWSGKPILDLEPSDLDYFCQAIEARAGIALKASKVDLIRTRLRSRVEASGQGSFHAYRRWLESLSPQDPEWVEFTNLLTTNKTDFFREAKHFDHLIQSVLPEWLDGGAQTFKVWSAASSTGEEAFTLAMILNRYLPEGKDFRILGTDIDTNVIATAQNAVYSMNRKSEIPAEYQSHLEVGQGEARGWFRIAPHLKERVTFKSHNLMDRTVPGENIFDLVLCRNVLIYFAPKTIEFVQSKLYAATRPGGYLYIGHSESFQGIHHKWISMDSSVYKKVS